MVRFQIVLDPQEADVLSAWAESEMRDPRDQIRFVLRRELERLGMLPLTHIDEADIYSEDETRRDR